MAETGICADPDCRQGRADFGDGASPFDIVHEIQIMGALSWHSLERIVAAMAGLGGELVSMKARRYGMRGDATIIRVKGVCECRIEAARSDLAVIKGVGQVSIVHHFHRRPRSGDAAV